MARPRFPLLVLSALLLAPVRARADASKASTMHYMKALMLQHRGDFQEALREYQSAVALDPNSTFLTEQAVSLALETGNAELALSLSSRLAQLEPKNPKARFLLGNVRWARGEAAAAQQEFEKALELNPRFVEAMLSLGNLLSAQSPDKARKYFEDYIKANPENAAEAHYQLGLIDQKEGRLDDAVRRLRASAELNPDNFQVRFSLAQAYEARKDTEAALGEYLSMLQRDTGNVALRNHIGEIYFLRGEPEKAAEQFQHVQALQPDNPTSCLWLAILAEQKGDFAAAAEHLARSGAVKDEAALNLRLSYYLTQANRLKEAIRVLEGANKKWPDNVEIAYFLALGYDDLKQPDKAVALLRGVIRSKPDFRDARFQLGALYEKNNKIEDAEREFRVLIEQKPNDASALNYLGYSLTDRGLKLPEAEGLIRRALAVDPGNGAYRDSLGWSHFKQGRYEEALRELLAAVKLLPADGTVWDHVGDAYDVFSDTGAAWTAWRKAEATEPTEKLRKKIAAAEAALSPEELGRRSLELAAEPLAGLASFGGSCEITGTVLGQPIRHTGLFAFRAPADLQVDLLGPLFVPVFRIRLSGDDSFEMDPIRVEGIQPEALQEAVYRSFQLVRDYLRGKLFAGRPAEFHKGWRTEWVSSPEGQFFFGDRRDRLRSFQAQSDGLRLTLEDFPEKDARRLPAALKLEGKGFSLEFRVPEPSVRFEEAASGR